MPARPPSKQPTPAEIITSLSLGYNGYTDPTTTKPQMWAPGSVNVFSGAFQYVQRARFANVFTQTPTGSPYTSLKYFALPGSGAWLIADQNGKLYSYDTNAAYAQTQRLNPYVDPAGTGSSQLNGPWSRESLENILYEMNGQVKAAGRLANAATIEGWGLDAPDSTPQVTINAGQTGTFTAISRSNGVVTATSATEPTISTTNVFLMNVVGVSDTSFNGSFSITVTGAGPFTFTWSQIGQNTTVGGALGSWNTQILKSVGRSYAFAWENANKAHIGPPSPVTQFILYNNQNGLIQIFEPGIVSCVGGASVIVTGVGTQFTSAWVGRSLWTNSTPSPNVRIVSVQSATQMTVASPPGTFGGNNFVIYDPQATHLRLYATADGGATYFRIARNVWNPNAIVQNSGVNFFDFANSEPPAFPFTTETVQLNNVPPPVGAFINEYQGVLLVYGVQGALQTFFYSNQTATSIGLLQESFAPLNQVTLPLASAQINGMLEFPGSLIIWSDKQDMFRMTGLLTDNTVTGVASGTAAAQQGAQIARLPYALGAANPFAMDITPLGGIWLTSNREIWLYTDRYAPRNIGRPVQDLLNSISPSQLALARGKYYHTVNRNWFVMAIPANSSTFNNTLLILDLDLLASNGSPSYFTFDMATNSPSWFVYQPGTLKNGQWTPRCDSLEAVYEMGGLVRLLLGQVDLIQDADYQAGAGTEISVPVAQLALHAYGNESAMAIKRPTWVRFNTNRDPAVLSEEVAYAITSIVRNAGLVTVTVNAPHGLQAAPFPDTVFITGTTDPSFVGAYFLNSVPSNTTFTFLQLGPNSTSAGGAAVSGWSFRVDAIDDDFYTFNQPQQLYLRPGVNDSAALSGNPDFAQTGLPFRFSPELFRIGAVNFVMGRRLKFVVNFPPAPGVNYQFRAVQLGFGVNPPS